MHRTDCIVVGAGVVGLAIARELALAGREVLVLEAADAIGTGASSRNSEVVHGGLYYAPGSLKARLAVRGREALYAYCEARGVVHRRCGKLIVATDDAERHALDTILARARANGVHEVTPLAGEAARELEPALRCVAALWSPVTGIVDSHGLMRALQADAEAAGAMVVLRAPFVDAVRVGEAWQVRAGDDDVPVTARWVINCAGLGAQRVARAMTGFPADAIPPLRAAKGHYFSLAGAAPFSRLVYPVPMDGGLGIHLTLDLAGQARFGPDVEWLTPGEGPWDYAVDATRADGFARDVRRYWPALDAAALRPAYAGIRAKLSGPGEATADFRIDGPAAHGAPGVVHCFGIESPGLTAALAIGAHVAATVGPRAIARRHATTR
jgi:L-2-hydroxyglutarate oxidase LhgO